MGSICIHFALCQAFLIIYGLEDSDGIVGTTLDEMLGKGEVNSTGSNDNDIY